jgi:hypothetical protein
MATTTATFPIVLNQSGYVPQTPAALQAQLIANVTLTNPGYTANLPASLVEDIVSTDVYALLQCDSSIAEIINSLTPYAANAFTLNQIGVQMGLTVGTPTNTSVYVVFTGVIGFVIPQGFIVSDGTYQYVIPNGGIIGAGNVSLPLYAVATVTGSWSVSANSVTQLITSVPSSIATGPPALSVTNPLAGTPSTASESEQSYRSRVLQANLASSQGTPRYLFTLLQNVSGVQSRLVAIKQVSPSTTWEIIVGGGDQYQVAYAIYYALSDINNLTSSQILVSAITKANPAVVTTTLNHGFSIGQTGITITGIVGMTILNGVSLTAISTPTLVTFGIGTTASISTVTWSASVVTVTTSSAMFGVTTSSSYTGTISGVSVSGYNGTFTCTITSSTTFTYPLASNPGGAGSGGTYQLPVDSTAGSFSAYVSGGIVLPNTRNVTTSILDYPNTYSVTFVNPPLQSVGVSLTWNTISTNYINPATIAQLGNAAIVSYINSIQVGQPINVFDMQNAFQTAVQTIIPIQLLTRMVFSVTINGFAATPQAGTGAIYGDAESYFLTNTASVSINQG